MCPYGPQKNQDKVYALSLVMFPDFAFKVDDKTTWIRASYSRLSIQCRLFQWLSCRILYSQLMVLAYRSIRPFVASTYGADSLIVKLPDLALVVDETSIPFRTTSGSITTNHGHSQR